jgi:glycosyltransferase involved in cell wall biosynthesis
MVVSQPLVSVVMPSLNQGQFIAEAIDSVLAQDYPRIELLVIDGASTDGTRAILESYGAKISWVSEKDRNLNEAVNKGIRRAQGQFVHTLASDELLYPGAVTNLVRHAQAREADVVVGQGHAIDAMSRIIAPIDNALPMEFEDILLLKKFMPLAFSFFKREVFDSYVFDEDFLTCADYLFWLNVLPRYRVVFVEDRVGAWRHHEGAWSVNYRASAAVYRARLQAFHKFFPNHPELRRLQGHAHVGASLGLARAHVAHGNVKGALGVMMGSLARRPLATMTYDRFALVRGGLRAGLRHVRGMGASRG